jgi:NitT/TauT family transport system substrate-binding protein
VAKDKGITRRKASTSTIKPGGPDIAPPQVIAGGGADVIVDWMPSALAAREKGVPLVNIAQPFKSLGHDADLPQGNRHHLAGRFPGKTLGVWFFGNEYPFLSWMSQLGIPTEGGDDGVTVLKQGFNVDPLIQKQADCISTMTYNEYWQVIDAGISRRTIWSPSNTRTRASPRWRTGSTCSRSLEDPALVDKMARFVRASMKGWKWAEENPDEAAMIVLENDATGAQTEKHQKRMMGEIAKLTAGSDGTLDEADYERTVATLLVRAGKLRAGRFLIRITAQEEPPIRSSPPKDLARRRLDPRKRSKRCPRACTCLSVKDLSAAILMR